MMWVSARPLLENNNSDQHGDHQGHSSKGQSNINTSVFRHFHSSNRVCLEERRRQIIIKCILFCTSSSFEGLAYLSSLKFSNEVFNFCIEILYLLLDCGIFRESGHEQSLALTVVHGELQLHEPPL
jgi:hypothetical protein